MRQPCYPLHHYQPAAQKNFQQSNKTFTRVRDWPRNMISDDTVAVFLLFREISEKFFFQTLTSHFFCFCLAYNHRFIHLSKQGTRPVSTWHLIRNGCPNLAKCSFYLGPDRGDLSAIFYARLH